MTKLRYTLTDEQRKFLERVVEASQFGFLNPFQLTTEIILQQGEYTTGDRRNLNERMIPEYKRWKTLNNHGR